MDCYKGSQPEIKLCKPLPWNTSLTMPMHARSGSIGVIMLDTRFPRFPGDVGNEQTWPFPVIFKVVEGTLAQDVVHATAQQDLQPFIDAAIELEQAGVLGITTSCGFLSLAQAEIASHLQVPFAASALVQLPWVQALLPPGRQCGILTIDSRALRPEHLRAAGIHTHPPVKGTEQGEEFCRAILDDAATMDKALCERDHVQAAKEFVHEHPQLGAIVLECTNMAPYAAAIHAATGLPVYSIYTLISWFQAGLAPASFNQ